MKMYTGYCTNCKKNIVSIKQKDFCPECDMIIFMQLKHNWSTIKTIENEDGEDGEFWQIDYDEVQNQYRVTKFIHNHFVDEVIFDEVR